jgi:hypothetical protein
MKLINTDKAEGTKVSGTYAGFFKFTGTVSAVRFAPRGAYIYTITLAAAITVFGQVREEITIWSNGDDAHSVEVVA